MIKKNLKLLILTSIIIILPVAAGLILWDKLPEQIPIHFNYQGVVDGYSSKPVAVFVFPLLMITIQWLCTFLTGLDPKIENISKKSMNLVLWIIPVLSLFLYTIIYALSLGKEFNITIPLMIFFGLFFAIAGNYLPKMSQSYTMGIKIPWTLNSKENWNYTHRLAGKVWVGGGLLIIATSFLNWVWLFAAVTAIMIIIPVTGSYLYHKKENNKE